MGNKIAECSNYSLESVGCNAEMFHQQLNQENGLSDLAHCEPAGAEGAVQTADELLLQTLNAVQAAVEEIDSVVLPGAHAAD